MPTLEELQKAPDFRVGGDEPGMTLEQLQAAPDFSLGPPQPAQPSIAKETGKGLLSGALNLAQSIGGSAVEAIGGALSSQTFGARAPFTAYQEAAPRIAQQQVVPPANPFEGQAEMARRVYAPAQEALAPDPSLANVSISPLKIGQQPDVTWQQYLAKLGRGIGETVPSAAAAAGGFAVGGPLGAGVVGGALEGLSEYEQAKQAGATEEEARRRLIGMGIGSAALNALPFASAASRFLGTGRASILARALVGAATEGTTETLEGPLAEVVKSGTQADWNQLWDAFVKESEVALPAAISGGAASTQAAFEGESAAARRTPTDIGVLDAMRLARSPQGRQITEMGQAASQYQAEQRAIEEERRLKEEERTLVRTAREQAPYSQFVNQAAEANSLPPDLLHALIEVESEGDTTFQTKEGDRVGLLGLTKHMGAQDIDRTQPRQNVEAGAKYFRALLDKHNQDLDAALAEWTLHGKGFKARNLNVILEMAHRRQPEIDQWRQTVKERAGIQDYEPEVQVQPGGIPSRARGIQPLPEAQRGALDIPQTPQQKASVLQGLSDDELIAAQNAFMQTGSKKELKDINNEIQRRAHAADMARRQVPAEFAPPDYTSTFEPLGVSIEEANALWDARTQQRDKLSKLQAVNIIRTAGKRNINEESAKPIRDVVNQRFLQAEDIVIRRLKQQLEREREENALRRDVNVDRLIEMGTRAIRDGDWQTAHNAVAELAQRKMGNAIPSVNIGEVQRPQMPPQAGIAAAQAPTEGMAQPPLPPAYLFRTNLFDNPPEAQRTPQIAPTALIQPSGPTQPGTGAPQPQPPAAGPARISKRNLVIQRAREQFGDIQQAPLADLQNREPETWKPKKGLPKTRAWNIVPDIIAQELESRGWTRTHASGESFYLTSPDGVTARISAHQSTGLKGQQADIRFEPRSATTGPGTLVAEDYETVGDAIRAIEAKRSLAAGPEAPTGKQDLQVQPPAPSVEQQAPALMTPEDLAGAFGLRIVREEEGGRYTHEEIGITNDKTPVQPVAENYWGDKDIASSKTVPADFEQAIHESLHRAFSDNPEQGHQAINALKAEGAQNAFEDLINIATVRFVDPAAKMPASVAKIVDSWLGAVFEDKGYVREGDRYVLKGRLAAPQQAPAPETGMLQPQEPPKQAWEMTSEEAKAAGISKYERFSAAQEALDKGKLLVTDQQYALLKQEGMEYGYSLVPPAWQLSEPPSSSGYRTDIDRKLSSMGIRKKERQELMDTATPRLGWRDVPVDYGWGGTSKPTERYSKRDTERIMQEGHRRAVQHAIEKGLPVPPEVTAALRLAPDNAGPAAAESPVAQEPLRFKKVGKGLVRVDGGYQGREIEIDNLSQEPGNKWQVLLDGQTAEVFRTLAAAKDYVQGDLRQELDQDAEAQKETAPEETAPEETYPVAESGVETRSPVPEKQKAQAQEKIKSHGLTQSQEDFLASQIEAEWRSLAPTNTQAAEEGGRILTIDVPGDGRFNITNQAAANALYKRVTGRWLEKPNKNTPQGKAALEAVKRPAKKPAPYTPKPWLGDREVESPIAQYANALGISEDQAEQLVENQRRAEQMFNEQQEQGPNEASIGMFEDIAAAAKQGKRFVQELYDRVQPVLSRSLQQALESGQTALQWAKDQIRALGSHMAPYVKRVAAEARRIATDNRGAAITPKGVMAAVKASKAGKAVKRNLSQYGGAPKNVFQALQKGKRAQAGEVLQAKSIGSAMQTLIRNRKVNEAAVAKALTGDKAAQAGLSPEARDMVTNMRGHITELQKRLAEHRKAQGNAGQAATILRSVGAYLHRSYKIFDPATTKDDWMKKAKAMPEWDQMAKKIGGYTKLNQIFEDLFQTKENLRAGKIGRADMTALMERKVKDPLLRKLMGEKTNPVEQYLDTIVTLSQDVAMFDMQKALLEQGKGKWLWDAKTVPQTKVAGGQPVLVGGPNNEKMGYLAGMYATPEVARVFNDLIRTQNQVGSFWKAIYAYDAYSKASKTAWNAPTGAVRQLWSDVMFVMTTGNTMRALKNLPKAARYTLLYNMAETLAGYRLTSPAAKKVLYKLAKKGLFDTEVVTGQIGEELAMMGLLQDTDVTRKNVIRRFGSALTTFYRTADNMTKVAAFFAIQDQYKAYAKSKGMTQDQLEDFAADMTMRWIPNSGLTNEIARSAGRVPIPSPFLRFHVSTMFAAGNVITDTTREIASGDPELRKIAVKRIPGIIGGMGMVVYGLEALSKALFGIDDDEEKVIRESLPDWAKRGTGLFYRDENGKTKHVDTQYMQGFPSTVGLAMNVLSSDSPQEAFEEFKRGMAETFFQGSMVIVPLMTLFYGRDPETGQEVILDENDWRQNMAAMAKTMLEPVLPGGKSYVRLYKALTSGKYYDQPVTTEDETFRILSGFTVTEPDPIGAFVRDASAYNFNRNWSKVAKDLKEFRGMSHSDAVREVNRRRKEEFKRLVEQVTTMVRANPSQYGRTKIKRALRKAGFGDQTARAIVFGRYRPYVPEED